MEEVLQSAYLIAMVSAKLLTRSKSILQFVKVFCCSNKIDFDFSCLQGNTEPAPPKDCVLIIDHETGELTLERWPIHSNVMNKEIEMEAMAVFENPV